MADSDSGAASPQRQLFGWLVGAAAGPAVVALPAGWLADKIWALSKDWVQRHLHWDESSQLLKSLLAHDDRLDRASFRELRELLESPETWRAVVNADELRLDDLRTLIAVGLARSTLSEASKQQVVETLARGLIEHNLAMLDPATFQHVLLARLDRLDQGIDRSDAAVLALTADASSGAQLDSQRHRSVIGHLGRVLDRLPAGPACRSTFILYLEKLIEELDTDQWRALSSGSLELTPSQIERTMLVSPNRNGGTTPADAVADSSDRLVVLGDPGSGKSWYAMRVARLAAHRALAAMRAGAQVAEVEIPLFTTCAAFLQQQEPVRLAAIKAALHKLPDIGSARLLESLEVALGERTDPTLLVLDSLDEAPRLDPQRLRSC
jgi:NACHT domain